MEREGAKPSPVTIPGREPEIVAHWTGGSIRVTDLPSKIVDPLDRYLEETMLGEGPAQDRSPLALSETLYPGGIVGDGDVGID